MRIREARPEDVTEIHRMIVELAEYEREPDAVVASVQDLHERLFAPTPAVFAHVAESDDGQVVGMAIWFLNFSTWLGRHGIYLEDLYVRESARGIGIGQALLRTLASLCIEQGYGRLEWWVLDWNQPAIDFYRAKGAVAMDEWTVYRVTGDALKELATQ